MATITQFGRTRDLAEAPDDTTPDFASRHYSPSEVGKLWRLSADTVRRMFEKEPGVLVIGDSSRRGRRRYVTLRIPASVVSRVHRKLSRV